MQALRVGLIGLGEIAQDLIELVDEYGRSQVELVGAVVQDPSKRCRSLPAYATVGELLRNDVDVVVEVAGHQGLRQHGPTVLEAGKDLILVAVGALADPVFEKRLREAAESSTGRARIASGVVGALDALAVAGLGHVDYVKHTVRWFSTPEMSADEITALPEPKELFRGTARQAALTYPKRVNVTAAVSLAGIGLDRTEVIIILDPAIERNVHLIEAEGSFGSLRFEMHPIPRAPGQEGGQLVAKSILHELIVRQSPVSIG